MRLPSCLKKLERYQTGVWVCHLDTLGFYCYYEDSSLYTRHTSLHLVSDKTTYHLASVTWPHFGHDRFEHGNCSCQFGFCVNHYMYIMVVFKLPYNHLYFDDKLIKMKLSLDL